MRPPDPGVALHLTIGSAPSTCSGAESSQTSSHSANPQPRAAAARSPRALSTERALVLFSGGQDSATCLVWALQRFASVDTVGFDYGQRHRVELSVRQDFLRELRHAMPHCAERLGSDHLLDASIIKSLGETAMTADLAIEWAAGGLPNTFVPGRNLLFLTLAAALAYRRGIKHLVLGVCETDFSGYPDCRDDTLKAMQVALGLGMDTRFVVDTPLMWLDKAATWGLADELGGPALVALVTEHTHTCYLGERTVRHAWGYGCGACPACELRKNGFERWGARAAAPH
jgi:7-cyano-7-deazaguanine synthase